MFRPKEVCVIEVQYLFHGSRIFQDKSLRKRNLQVILIQNTLKNITLIFTGVQNFSRVKFGALS